MRNQDNKTTAAEALKTLENAQGKDFYTVEYQDALNVALDALREKVNPTAHWIFSGDEDDYDGYYINCSKCGSQRKVYDRDCDLDVPVACPHCGSMIDRASWEYAEPERNVERSYQVSVIYNTGRVKRPYIFNVMARNEDQAKEKALNDVSKMLDADEKMRKRMYVDYVELVEEED
jgi:hypothetical protein